MICCVERVQTREPEGKGKGWWKSLAGLPLDWFLPQLGEPTSGRFHRH
jgi:hypothetical protein